VSCIKKAENGEFGFKTHSDSESEHYPQVALQLFCAADLPFSLIGDVVTWPYTAAYSFINQPIPTPPVTTQGTAGGQPQTLFAPENKEAEKKAPEKDADQSKQKNDKPAKLPMSLPQPSQAN
jgi:hypothetical protein